MAPSIKSFIANYIDTDYKVEDDLPFPVTIKEIPKNTIITQIGQVEKYAYFLLSGIAKIDMIRNGEESILEFFFPGSFFSSYTSFLSQKGSDVELMTLSDCAVEVIKYEDMQTAYKHSLLANKLGRIVIEQYYIHKTNREKGFLTKSATERYRELLNFRPELVQQIPVKMIAQYLGIQPESLSRIRKEIS
ncbi:MAG: Crp/Fnr family transcriptional regulator [Bacteroidetes bacterium]|nr:Crp/Fnr family transcriptional regulator [Bacteroidota bacterium]